MRLELKVLKDSLAPQAYLAQQVLKVPQEWLAQRVPQDHKDPLD